MSSIEKLIRYEQGEMNEDETIEFFQELVDTGMAWDLQGSYGRTAAVLIEYGYVTPPSAIAGPEESSGD